MSWAFLEKWGEELSWPQADPSWLHRAEQRHSKERKGYGISSLHLSHHVSCSEIWGLSSSVKTEVTALFPYWHLIRTNRSLISCGSSFMWQKFSLQVISIQILRAGYQSVSPEPEISSAGSCHQWNPTWITQNRSWHLPPKHFGNHWQAFPQEGRCTTAAPCRSKSSWSLSSSLASDISSPQKPSCPHMVPTTTSKTGLWCLHEGQNKIVAIN